MKRFIIAVLIALLCMVSVKAQILWQISGNGTKETSYILGTHHLAPLSTLDSIKGFDEALKAVDAVIGEVDMAKMTAEMQSLTPLMLAPADSTLTAVLNPDRTDSLNAVLAKTLGPQFTTAQLAMLKPAAVATQLAMAEAMSVMGPETARALATGQQLDTEVQKRAIAMGKEVIGFETARQQLGMLMGNPISEQVVSLMQAVGEMLSGKSAENAIRLTQAYTSQNLPAIEALVFDPSSMNEADTRRLITGRNAAWAEQLDGMLATKSVLVAVGAGHLPGPQGLIELLRKAGYTVTPVE